MSDFLRTISDLFKPKKAATPAASQTAVTEAPMPAETPSPKSEAIVAPETDPNAEQWEKRGYYFMRAYRSVAQADASYNIQQPGDKKDKEKAVIQNNGTNVFVLNLPAIQTDAPLPLEAFNNIVASLNLKDTEEPATVAGIELHNSDVIPRIVIVTSAGDRIKLDVQKPPHEGLRKSSTPLPLRAVVEDARTTAEKAMRNHKLQQLQDNTGEETGVAMIELADAAMNSAQLEIARRNIAAYGEKPITGYVRNPSGRGVMHEPDPKKYMQFIAMGFIPVPEDEGKALFADKKSTGAVVQAAGNLFAAGLRGEQDTEPPQD